MANKMDQFTKLLDELSDIGYEADNMDCMKMEYSDGYGVVTFTSKDDVRVQLPFAFWKLDLSVTPEQLIDQMKQARHCLVPITVESYRDQ